MCRLLMLFSAIVLMATPLQAKTWSGTITMEFDLSNQARSEVVELWIPYPLSDRDQSIADIDYRGTFTTVGVYSERTYSTPMLYARWEAGAKERTLSLRFAVERDEVLRRDLPAAEPAWNRADFSQWLGATANGPIDGPVKALADHIVGDKVTVLAKTRAIYDWICDNMVRDSDTRGCGSGEVCTLLEKPGGKCADIHSVFVALARAAGVPAREIFGIRQGKKNPTDITGWQHCWAEFYLPGSGWIPVDPGDVRKMMLKEKLAEDSAAAADYRAYFWGGIDPYRVKLSVGRDLTLNPPQAGPPLNYLMYPYAEVAGLPIDWLDPKSFKYRISWTK